MPQGFRKIRRSGTGVPKAKMIDKPCLLRYILVREALSTTISKGVTNGKMKTITLKKEKIHSGSLLLVNARYPMKNQEEIVLAPVDARFPEIRMESRAADFLRLILKYILSEDEIVPVSGYRSSEEQTAIFEDSLEQNGEIFTRQFVALPGHSEHQTGLAIDLGLNQEEIDFICPEFPFQGICGTFRNIAPDYGFIQRYGKDKESITGIAHEPWHFRYVGYPHSRIITDGNFSM